MINKIVTDSDLNVELVINLQEPRTFDDTWANSIIIEINADDTASQELVVDAGSAGSTTYAITAGQLNEIEIELEYWNMGGTTSVTLSKAGFDYGDLSFAFPQVIDSLGMLNQDENDNTKFSMTGSSNDPSDLSQRVSEVSAKVEEMETGKQNFIDQDILEPVAGSGENGDLKFKGINGNGEKELWRNDEGTWVKINLGGGGHVNDAGLSRKLLYQAPDRVLETVLQLSDDIRNYQYLEIYCEESKNVQPRSQASFFINVEYFMRSCPYVANPSSTSVPHFLLQIYYTYFARILCGADYTKLQTFSSQNTAIMEIYGVNFGRSYSSRETIYGSFNGHTLYEQTILFYDQGSLANGWTNISGTIYEYDHIGAGYIDSLWSADVINCNQSGEYSFNDSPSVSWDKTDGYFNLNFQTGFYTWLHIVYMK